MKQTQKDRKNTEKENNTDERENEILDLNSLKPFEFESKTNIINSISSDYEEKGIEYEVKRISNSEQ